MKTSKNRRKPSKYLRTHFKENVTKERERERKREREKERKRKGEIRGTQGCAARPAARVEDMGAVQGRRIVVVRSKSANTSDILGKLLDILII